MQCMGDDYSYVGAVVGATYPETVSYTHLDVYKRQLRYSVLGNSVNIPGKSGRWLSRMGYKVMNKLIGFN